MEYDIISSGIIRNHADEKEEEDEEKKPRAQQQVKVLKFRTLDDDDDDEINTVRERDSESEEQGVNYLLRENPKKSKRFVVMESINKELNDNINVCKECGKGFQSLKALCGHMASHSEKDRLRGRFKEEKASDTESLGPKKKKRRRRRVSERKVGDFVGSFFGAEREQQEVAISLMLLSRDSGGYYKGAPSDDSVVESSSNNGSIVLEAEIAKSKPRPMIILEDDDGSENSDSGYFRNGPKKGESSNALLEAESRPELLGKKSTLVGDAKYELRKRSRKTISRLDGPESAQKRTKYECSTCKKTFSSHTALGGHRASHAKTNAAVAAAAANNNHCGSVCSLGENSIETDEPAARPTRELGPSPSPIKKGHECPICFRMFKSGQALGGHKRSHFVVGREASSAAMIRREPTHDIEPEPEPEQPEIAVLFDLNLPAPVEEEGEDGNVGFMEW